MVCCFKLSFADQYNQLSLKMGTIESKIKEGYSIKRKPVFKKGCLKGKMPVADLEEKRTISSNRKKQQMGNNQAATNGKQVGMEVEIGQGEHLPQRRDLSENSKRYPASAIGLIQSRINGVTKYGTGGLISSNIVITSAHSLIYNGIAADHAETRFVLSALNDKVEFEVQKIYIPFDFKNQLNNQKQFKEKYFLFDYAVIVLKNHVDIQKFGTLGFDFNRQSEDGHSQLTTFGFNQRNYAFKLESIHLKAKIQENTIKFTNYQKMEVSGGPILSTSNDEFMIVGLYNSSIIDQQLPEQRCLKLHDQMYNQLSEWITRQEEEIDIRDKNLGKEGIKKLVNLKWTTLHSINISRNNLGMEGLKYFAKCQWLNLYHFDIGGNEIRKEGVHYLVKIPMRNLVTLNMWGNSIGSEGASHLLDANWKHLTSINLYNNNINNDGVKKLIEANWEELESLNLGKNSISTHIIPYLQYTVWKNIISLTLCTCLLMKGGTRQKKTRQFWQS